MSVNLTGSRFKVGDRVVHINAPSSPAGTVLWVPTSGHIVLRWDGDRRTTAVRACALEPAER